MRRLRILLLALCCLAGAGAAAAEPKHSQSNYIRFDLPTGVSFDLPRNWVVVDEHGRITMDAAVEATREKLMGKYTTELPFAAHLLGSKGSVIALMNVRSYPAVEFTQADVKEFTERDLEAFNAAMRKSMTAVAEASGLKIVHWGGTRFETVGGYRAMVTIYRRIRISEPNKVFRVKLVRIWAGPKSFTLSVSLLEQVQPLLQPIADRIVESLALR